MVQVTWLEDYIELWPKRKPIKEAIDHYGSWYSTKMVEDA